MASIGEEEEIKKKTEDKTGEGYGVGKLYETHVIAVTTFQREMSAVRAVVEAEEIKCARGKDAKIFDTDLYNFHLYPEEIMRMKIIADEISVTRKNVVDKLKEIAEGSGIDVFPRIGSKGYIASLKETPYEEKGANKLYRYIAARKNDTLYELNFMRFFIDGEGNDKKVNCILKEIQFDRSLYKSKGEYVVNCGETGKFDIAYPELYQSQSEDDLKNILEERKGKSFCYNPALSFYDTPQRIAEAFIAFINECERWSKTNG